MWITFSFHIFYATINVDINDLKNKPFYIIMKSNAFYQNSIFKTDTKWHYHGLLTFCST